MHDSRKWHINSKDAKRVHVTSYDCEIIWDAAVKSVKNNLPTELTAENGAKALLSGEFSEEASFYCHGCHGEGCEECGDVGTHNTKIYVSWTTIKEIYKKIVNYYGE